MRSFRHSTGVLSIIHWLNMRSEAQCTRAPSATVRDARRPQRATSRNREGQVRAHAMIMGSERGAEKGTGMGEGCKWRWAPCAVGWGTCGCVAECARAGAAEGRGAGPSAARIGTTAGVYI